MRRLIPLALLCLASLAHAADSSPRYCTADPVPEGTDAEVAVSFASWVPTSATIRVDAHTVSPSVELLAPTAGTVTTTGFTAVIPAATNVIAGTARQDNTEPHLVTLRWWGVCRGGINVGVACDADTDCPSSTCQAGGIDCVIRVQARSFVPAPTPTATP